MISKNQVETKSKQLANLPGNMHLIHSSLTSVILSLGQTDERGMNGFADVVGPGIGAQATRRLRSNACIVSM